MKKRRKLYEGKAKILYATDEPHLLIQYFKDDATAFDAMKRGVISDKGHCNNQISARLFCVLEKNHIPTHFVKRLGEREMLVKRVKIIPLEVTMRNIVAGGMSKRLGLDEGKKLKQPVLEYHYKSDALHDPLINDDHILVLGIVREKELDLIKEMSFKINKVLRRFFGQRNLELVDFKLEFGRFKKRILLADEISPDTCRLWDKKTKQKLDKDRFRRDLGNVKEAYKEVLKRVL
ncbi:MAG: phosphoribosylaminoimidazolesuccinocarboxamide synthase [Candidatus Omnitrophica bacterium]|nr:phosphoribosylaminoimidazolesuccinocarboxamide synthase [Candidatus Omnitrophota bacterium]